MQLKRIVAGASAAAVLASLVPATAITSAGATTGGDQCWPQKPTERRFAKKMNAARARRGRRPLRLDPQLSHVARRHTRAMVRRNLLHHSTRSQLRRRITNWTTLGENVGVGGGVRSLHRAFMSSYGHRANITSRGFRHVGVGTRRAHGRLWVTVVFQARANPGTTLRPPSC
jgi:uncharacterized protein YkwD